jgi:aryl-alcohol dehydrogenase-like predicted oxidoreductase
MMRTTRREFAVLGTAALVAHPASAQNNAASPIARAIPRTGERIPAVGLGTAYVFDRENEQTRSSATEVVRALIQSGGQLIDTASTYGDAESVLGNVIAREGTREKLFIATKLEAPDAAELKRSLSRLKTAKLDLLQFHNVCNPRQSLAQFKAWKAQGICRYIGVTSTFHGDFAAMVYHWRSLQRVEQPYALWRQGVPRLQGKLPQGAVATWHGPARYRSQRQFLHAGARRSLGSRANRPRRFRPRNVRHLAGRDGCACSYFELSADQQRLQRLQPDFDSDRRN